MHVGINLQLLSKLRVIYFICLSNHSNMHEGNYLFAMAKAFIIETVLTNI